MTGIPDPEQGAPPAGPQGHARHVRAVFPATLVEDTLDSIELSIDGDRGCLVRLTATSAEIRLPTTHWDKGAYDPIPSSRFWKRISLRDTPADYSRLDGAIEAALAARRAEFQPCSFCRQEFPPEHRTGDACHACAARHLGVTY